MLTTLQGVIKEVAEHQVGGEAKLKAAILRGAVIVGDEDDPLYYFKSAQIGEEESFDTVQALSRGKNTTASVFDTYKETIDGLGWSMKCKAIDLEAPTNVKHVCKHTFQ